MSSKTFSGEKALDENTKIVQSPPCICDFRVVHLMYPIEINHLSRHCNLYPSTFHRKSSEARGSGKIRRGVSPSPPRPPAAGVTSPASFRLQDKANL